MDITLINELFQKQLNTSYRQIYKFGNISSYQSILKDYEHLNENKEYENKDVWSEVKDCLDSLFKGTHLETILALKNLKMVKRETPIQLEMCNICWNTFDDVECKECNIYGCGHYFHKECSDMDIANRNKFSCPYCRSEGEYMSFSKTWIEENHLVNLKQKCNIKSQIISIQKKVRKSLLNEGSCCKKLKGKNRTCNKKKNSSFILYDFQCSEFYVFNTCSLHKPKFE